jgi:hypothetical protein
VFFKNNADRYAKYHDKIIHVVVPDMNNPDPWQNERHQRDAILAGLVNASADDIAIISDVDEFICPETITELRNSSAQVFGLRMPYFNFKFNYMVVGDVETYCVWPMACRVEHLASPEDLRKSRWDLNTLPLEFNDGTIHMLEHAGWHFTYLGDTEFIKNKIRSFAHSELNNDGILDRIDVDAMMEKGIGHNPDNARKFVKVNLDDYFPKALLNYPQYCAENTKHSVWEFLPKTSEMMSLAELANEDQFNTDKNYAHKYIPEFYSKEFASRRNDPITLLEIGMWYGKSMSLWHKYFTNATIIGVDVEDRGLDYVRAMPRNQVIIQDAYDPVFVASLPNMDIIIDDGPHSEESQIQFLELYLPKLNENGIAIIEDILKPESVEKFKQLVPEGYTYEVVDIRHLSELPESILFIVRK